MGTDIEVGPSGRQLLPISPVGQGSPVRNPAFAATTG
jgi:hypothetical protein